MIIGNYLNHKLGEKKIERKKISNLSISCHSKAKYNKQNFHPLTLQVEIFRSTKEIFNGQIRNCSTLNCLEIFHLDI
jgi:hypothetical protein